MLQRTLQCLGILSLAITAIAEVEPISCDKLPMDDYATIMSCCKDSPIPYFEEMMYKCRFFNSTEENVYHDLILMNVCETSCYLNQYEVINKNGSVRVEKLVDFLKIHLPEPLHDPLAGFVTKCFPTVEYLNDFRIYPPHCHWYYTALIGCIQGEIYVNCPESEKVSSEACEDSREFVRFCSITALQDAFDHNGMLLNRTDASEESSSDYSSDESSSSYSFSSEYDSGV